VTCSASTTVELAIRRLAASRTLLVPAAEARPRMEGRDMARRLGASGIATELFTDAAIATALSTGAVLLVGADAVTPDGAFNKVGTRALATLASLAGQPVIVAATREKLVPGDIAELLDHTEGPSEDVAPAEPPGFTVRNPQFELVPAELITGFATDLGWIPGPLIGPACEPRLGGEARRRLRAALRLPKP
jgi:translation initiation factor eIF-2B subunit delta/methylthioribose-1-phosphate isomerase